MFYERHGRIPLWKRTYEEFCPVQASCFEPRLTAMKTYSRKQLSYLLSDKSPLTPKQKDKLEMDIEAGALTIVPAKRKGGRRILD